MTKIITAIIVIIIGFTILNASLVFFFVYALIVGYYIYSGYKSVDTSPSFAPIKQTPYSVNLRLNSGVLTLTNPFRGLFVVGSAGSGKSESVAVPLLLEFIKKNYCGVVYDFKFPTLANEIENISNDQNSTLKRYFISFDTNYHSNKINPIAPEYLLNTSYAREYAQAIISNLMRETIKKPDYWSRSATDILTACIWYLREEHPEKCDIPHLFALITSSDEKLMKLLQTNIITQQMTISIFSAMERGADSQVSGVIGTLQGAIAQINTPELMHVFSANEVPLNINNPLNPILLTIGNNPTLSSTFAPLCSLIITVATKMMNQPEKHHSFLMLDEAPTIYIPNLEVIPNTGRSNKISTVIMCQDLSQLTDGYGKEKADVLFSACNNHFYGRVSSSSTAETLSKQFGKENQTFTTTSVQSKSAILGRQETGQGVGQSIQEREIIKPSEFLKFPVGYFTGVAVESNQDIFKGRFLQVQRSSEPHIKAHFESVDHYTYYKKVRANITTILNGEEQKKEVDTFDEI
jgi:type IV secretory pathway TraG/TraD family ATPase VirD4